MLQAKLIIIPKQAEKEENEKLCGRLHDWDSNNHKIITWISNTSISSIGMSLGRFNTAKEVQDFLASRYAIGDMAQQHQLLRELHSMKQITGQTIHDFYSKMAFVREQLTLA